MKNMRHMKRKNRRCLLPPHSINSRTADQSSVASNPTVPPRFPAGTNINMRQFAWAWDRELLSPSASTDNVSCGRTIPTGAVPIVPVLDAFEVVFYQHWISGIINYPSKGNATELREEQEVINMYRTEWVSASKKKHGCFCNSNLQDQS